MTDETPSPSTDLPPSGTALPERARIEPSPPPKRLDALPVLYLVGFVILAASLIYLWKHPALPRNAALEVARMDTVRQRTDEMQARIDKLEARPMAAPANLAPLEARIGELERRPPPAIPDLGVIQGRLTVLEAQAKAPPTEIKPLQDRMAAVEAQAKTPPAEIKPMQDRIAALETQAKDLPSALKPLQDRLATLEAQQSALKDLQDRLAGLEARPPVDLTPLQKRVDAAVQQSTEANTALDKKLGSRLDQVDAQAKQTASSLASVALKANQAGRLQAASAALEAGQRLGDVPGAPAALARFAHDAPPTEAGLRLGFDKAADAAHRASQPALTDNQGFASRMWTRAQQAVTVRQGEHVLVGDPIAGVLTTARQALDAGDLAGAVKVLDAMDAPAKAAMADWLAQAHALLDARAAIGEMAARG